MTLQDIEKDYRLEVVDKKRDWGPYRFHGKRGAVLTLVRNKVHPWRMFVINGNSSVVSIRGVKWFADGDAVNGAGGSDLRPV